MDDLTSPPSFDDLPEPDEMMELPADLEGEGDRIEEMQAEIDDLKAQLLRSYADLQNFRKRSKQQLDDLRLYGQEDFVQALLPVLDNFERTVTAVEGGASLESIAEGVKMVQRQLFSALETHGVSKIATLGQEFDPEVHEAVATWSGDGQADGVVTDEIAAGFMLADRVIRPAKVRVVRNG